MQRRAGEARRELSAPHPYAPWSTSRSGQYACFGTSAGISGREGPAGRNYEHGVSSFRDKHKRSVPELFVSQGRLTACGPQQLPLCGRSASGDSTPPTTAYKPTSNLRRPPAARADVLGYLLARSIIFQAAKAHFSFDCSRAIGRRQALPAIFACSAERGTRYNPRAKKGW